MLNSGKHMVEEHSQLVVRIQILHEYIYSDKNNDDNKIEFANKCIQLAAMKKYEEALRARLENQGIFFENGIYLERIGCILPHCSKPENTSKEETETETENAEQ